MYEFLFHLISKGHYIVGHDNSILAVARCITIHVKMNVTVVPAAQIILHSSSCNEAMADFDVCI